MAETSPAAGDEHEPEMMNRRLTAVKQGFWGPI